MYLFLFGHAFVGCSRKWLEGVEMLQQQLHPLHVLLVNGKKQRVPGLDAGLQQDLDQLGFSLMMAMDRAVLS